MPFKTEYHGLKQNRTTTTQLIAITEITDMIKESIVQILRIFKPPGNLLGTLPVNIRGMFLFHPRH